MSEKLALSHIKPSPNPIRKTWDETKMEELKWSLMEEGQVEPIGVHKNTHGYVIVWGHRRVEAARRAGWTEIAAEIVSEDEVDNLIQAGIENLAGEDMTADEKADWAQRLRVLGLSIAEISRRSTVPETTLSDWLLFLKEDEVREILDIQDSSRDEGVRKVRDIARILGNNIEAKKAVATKSNDDRLGQIQTRAVAEAYRDAPTPAVRAAVLKAPIVSRDTAADILRRATHRVEMDGSIQSQQEVNDWQKEREERRSFQDFDFAVKEFLDSARLFMEVAQKGHALVKYGKYSPEAASFAIRKIDQLIDALKNYKEELEQVK
jgi:ParB/RepB/Spo0J family partition protein